ncbi:hypothetical protein [Pseudomonas sp. AU10]|uniref:hypothetical protein n=1 Tax=Pseudomonas sp. AU10 TaxID=882697 RepID=UPI0021E1C93C|nr:hypothetical protein [Pseudomonas sp. AU10]MCV2226883.1 hypothetical protein [Pseudomonas sp. AU10]
MTSVTCKVEGQAQGANGATKDVELDGVPASALASAKKVANLKGFSIVVGVAGDSSCTNGTNALVRFDPSSPAIDVASGNLKVGGWDKQDDATTAVINLGAQYYVTGAASAGAVATRVLLGAGGASCDQYHRAGFCSGL